MVRALFALILFASQAFAGAMRGDEAAAIAVAVERFKNIYAKPDLRHYSVEYARHGKELTVTFLADEPTKHSAPDHARTGGGSIYGPDMTYVVSLTTLKVLRFNFYR
jgi:predicted metalloendopeptidase